MKVLVMVGVWEFDSQELQEAINEINEAQGQNTTELDAAMNGTGRVGGNGRENSGAEAWSEGAMSAERGDRTRSLQEAMAGATVYEGEWFGEYRRKKL